MALWPLIIPSILYKLKVFPWLLCYQDQSLQEQHLKRRTQYGNRSMRYKLEWDLQYRIPARKALQISRTYLSSICLPIWGLFFVDESSSWIDSSDIASILFWVLYLARVESFTFQLMLVPSTLLKKAIMSVTTLESSASLSKSLSSFQWSSLQLLLVSLFYGSEKFILFKCHM